MAVTTTKTNKPLNPRGNDQSPKGYNRAELYSGKALDFDGVNDYVDLDGFTLSGTTATISFYYKTDSNKALAYIFDNTQRWVIGQADTTDSFGFYDGSTWRKSTQTLTLGEWYHITAVIDGGNVEFLWNGQSIGDTFTGANPISWASLTTFKLGWSYSATGFGQVDGQIAGFRIFNTALTAAQVADLYNNPEKIVPTGVADSALKLWLPMQEGAGTTAYDGSGNGNHGTISGATYVHGVGSPVAQTAVIDWNKGSNKVLQSNTFNNTSWTKIQVTTSSGATGFDGDNEAWRITENATSAVHYLYQNAVTTGTNTISLYAKTNGRDLQLRVDGVGVNKAFVNYDLSAGSIGLSGGTALINSNIESVGNDWYRCSFSVNDPGTYGVSIVMITDASSSTELQSYLGNGTSGVFIQYAQIEQGTTAGPYIPTLSTAQTSDVLLPQGLTSGRDITGVNLFENVRKQGALNLDGNSWAEVHDNASLDITDAITLETWYYHDTSTTNEGLLGRWNATTTTYLLLKNDTNVRFYTKSTSAINVNASVSTAGWHHVVGTYDGITMRIYLDGSESATIGQTGSINTSTFPLEIGRYYDSETYAQTGAIAQPRIYNRALTAEEVERNYNAGKNIYK